MSTLAQIADQSTMSGGDLRGLLLIVAGILVAMRVAVWLGGRQ